MKSVGARIKQVRQFHSLTQEQFGKRVAISGKSVSAIESDNRSITDRTFGDICRVFGVNAEWLRTGEGEMRTKRSSIPNDMLHTREKEFAGYFWRIFRAMAPSCKYEHQLMEIFQMDVSSGIFNYIAARLINDLSDKHEPDRIHALFKIAFPDYEKVIEKLRKKAEPLVEQMDQSTFSHLMDAPVQGLAAAGKPINDSTSSDMIPIPEKYLDRHRFFVVQAIGDSMIPKIGDGDFVIVQKDTPPEIGAPALISVEGMDVEYTIKMLTHDSDNDNFILRSFNPEYEPMIYPSEQIIKAERIVHIIHR